MAKKATPTTVTLKHLAAALSEEHEMSKKQTEAVLGDLVTMVTKHLKKGERIRIVGLGILQVRKRAARMGRNPATGEAIHIKASKKVAFRAAKELKGSGVTLSSPRLAQKACPAATSRRGFLCVRAMPACRARSSRLQCAPLPLASARSLLPLRERRLVGGDGIEPPTSCV